MNELKKIKKYGKRQKNVISEKWFSARKAELFMLLKTGTFHFALTE